MSKLVPTYVREGGEVLAFFEGQVIAKDVVFAKAEKTALDYLETLSEQRSNTEEDKKKKTATHITTPNGMKGEILNRTDGLWGEEYTVRFENGRIAKLQTHAGDPKDVEYSTEIPEVPEDENDELQTTLDEDYSHDKPSLSKRLVQLDELITTASVRVARASETDMERLNKIILAAGHEKDEVGEALAYLEQSDAEAFAPPSFQSSVVEQADLGRSKNDLTTSWLDHVASDMIAESADQNFEKMLLEEPAQIVAGLETGTIAEQGTTAVHAREYITSKTAAFQGAEVEEYREKFIAATEQARRAELADRAARTAKTATAQETDVVDAPDAALFM